MSLQGTRLKGCGPTWGSRVAGSPFLDAASQSERICRPRCEHKAIPQEFAEQPLPRSQQKYEAEGVDHWKAQASAGVGPKQNAK